MAKVCSKPGCPQIVEAGYCVEHERERKRVYDQRRGSAHRRGYTRAWTKASKAYLQRHRWCVMCEAEGLKTQATEVDHIIPHRGDKRLFWDRNNWQSLCHSHHSAKTMAEIHGREYKPKGNDERGQARGRHMSDWFTRWGDP